MVETFVQPNFTTQDAASYKAALDKSIAVLAEISKAFAPREMAAPGMGVTIEAGSLGDGTPIAAANVTGIGAPVGNPRIDRIYLALATGVFTRIAGTAAAVPVPPALPTGAYAIAQVYLIPGQTIIGNADLLDERSSIMYVPLRIFGNYTEILDPLGIPRIIMGKAGSDNRIIVRLHGDEGGSTLVIQNSAFTGLGTINGAGDLAWAGKFAVNNAVPQAKAVVPAAATDASTTQALVNALRLALVNNGIAV